MQKKGRRLIILYELGESGGFTGLGIIIMIKNFQSRRKYESLSIAFYMRVNDKIAFLGS